MEPKFELGRIMMTRGIAELSDSEELEAVAKVAEHALGNWGEVDPEDAALNDAAVASGEDRILSAYTLASGARIWIITEWDRSITTILLPEEY